MEKLLKVKLSGLVLLACFALSGCEKQQEPISSSTPSPVIENAEFNSVQVVDEYGVYMRDSSVLNYKVQDWDTYNSGLSDEENVELQNWITNFVMTEALDSIALDNFNAWDDWRTNVAPKYIHSQYLDEIQNSDKLVILAERNASENIVPSLSRNGESRLLEKNIRTGKTTQDSENKKLFYIEMFGSWEVLIDEESFVEWDLANTSGMTELFLEAYKNDPSYNDGQNEKVHSDWRLTYIVTKEAGDWKIVGSNNSFNTGLVN